MAHLEDRRKIHGRNLAFDRFGDAFAAMAGIAAP
ncbi:Beta alanine-pyruvate transaminase [Brucella melitensis NI]|nr:Beta alanine-pyruvate transaminase [Brucella melitensis NI]